MTPVQGVRKVLPPQRSVERHHVEVILGDTAIGAHPIVGHVVPARAGRNAFFGQTGCLVVDEAAHDTHVRTVDGGLD